MLLNVDKRPHGWQITPVVLHPSLWCIVVLNAFVMCVCVCQSKRFSDDPSPTFTAAVRFLRESATVRGRGASSERQSLVRIHGMTDCPPENTINRAIRSRIRGHLHTNGAPVRINDGWARKFRLHHAFRFSRLKDAASHEVNGRKLERKWQIDTNVSLRQRIIPQVAPEICGSERRAADFLGK